MPDSPQMPIHAYIFDMDDTLVATANLWRQTEQRVLAMHGHDWTAELSAQYKGMNALDVAATMHRVLGLSADVAVVQHDMRSTLIEAFKSTTIEPIPEAIDLVKRMATHGKPMAVASGSPLEAINLALDSLQITDYFAQRITSESVPRGKPHPDVFLKTARTLNVDPQHCVVFEDSLIGAQAALAAGMTCIVRPSLPHPDFATLPITCITSWTHFPPHE